MSDDVQTEPRIDSIRLIKLAMDTLAQRVYRWAVLACSFSLFATTVYRPQPWRLAAAATFTLFVYVPLAWRERGR